MFTGIIQTIGEVTAVSKSAGDLRVVIQADGLQQQTIEIGDSVACNGVCLTVVEINLANEKPSMAFDVSIESLDHSLIGNWQIGSKVNLELAMLPTTRFGGHLVSGHVDGVAQLMSQQADARSTRMVFQLPDELKKYVAKKGSVTINGVSLTVNSVQDNAFDINIIPHTFEVTTLGELTPGDKVHIEVDLIARYLERLLNADTKTDEPISHRFLADHGFA